MLQINFFKKSYWKGQRLLLLAFLVVHTLLTLFYLDQQPLTNDEADYIEYSKRWLKGKPLKILDVDDSKTPITAVAWLPRVIKQFKNNNLQLADWGRSDQIAGRYIMIIFFWGVFLYTYLWAKNLYGSGWIMPVLLLVIDPLFMSFSPIVTSDMACVFMVLATMYHAYIFHKTSNTKHFLLMSLFSGLALITKSSLIFLPLILFIVFTLQFLYFKKHRKLHLDFIKRIVQYLLICLFIVNGGFYFYNTFLPWESFQFKSHAFLKLVDQLSFIKPIPRLLPEPFIQGFDLLQYHKEIGPSNPNLPFKGVFIWGEKYSHGVWFYYLFTGLIKIPIGLIFLFILTFYFLLKKFRLNGFINTYQFLLVPVIVYGVVLSFFNPFQQGLRHAMILFPFLYLGVGYVWNYFSNFLIKGKIIFYACIVYSLISTGLAFPDIMHYSNEFVLNKKNLFKYIAEFNYRHDNIKIDCDPFLQKHPEYEIAPSTPSVGNYIVPGAFVYNSTYEVYENFKWLKDFEPVGHYRTVYLLYEIDEEDLKKQDLKTN